MISQENAMFQGLYQHEILSINEVAQQINDFVQKYKNCDVLECVTKSNLRERGEAQNLISKKWKALMRSSNTSKFLIVTASDGFEFHEGIRFLLDHEIINIFAGLLLIMSALSIKKCYFAVNEIYDYERINEIASQVSANVEVIKIPNEYILSDETALINFIYRKASYPTQTPPYPTVQGIFDMPTVVHSIETVANIAQLCRYGYLYFLNVGTKNSIGTKLFFISGDAENHCLIEEEYGISFSKLVMNACPEMRFGLNDVFALMPGSNAPIFAIGLRQLHMTIEHFQAAKSNIGSGKLHIFRTRDTLFRHLRTTFDNFIVQSCKQCSPCHFGCTILRQALDDVYDSDSVPDEILAFAQNMKITSMCPFGKKVATTFLGIINNSGI